MRDPDGLLSRAGLTPDPDRDQHFLVDDRVLDRLPDYLPGGWDGAGDPGSHTDAAETDADAAETDADAADTDTNADAADTDADAPDDTGADGVHALEVGAGTGALTDRLLARADRVTAVERDAALAAFLREEFADAVAAGRLDVLEGDALDVELPAFDACVSNLPYGVASPLLFELLPERRPLVVTVQYEFAERMAAEPGTSEYGRLSVTAGHYASVELVERVPPEAFVPPPAVDSAVVRATPRDPAYEVPDDGRFLSLVKALFTQRRKTLRNGLRNTAHISGLADPEAVVGALDGDLLGKRPDATTPAEFARIAAVAADVGGYG